MTRSSPRPAGPKRRFFTVDEIADAMGVSSKTVRRRIAGGDLHAHRIGGVLRVSEDDYDSFIALQRR